MPFFGEDFYEACWDLGEILVEAWPARLRQEYPDRQFALRLVDSDEKMDMRIEVEQVSPALVVPARWWK